MRHLYLRIYFAFIGILVTFMLLMSFAWWALRDDDDRRSLDGIAVLVSAALPPADAPRANLQTAIDALAPRLTSRLTVRAADGSLLAHSGEPLPPPPPGLERSGFRHLPGVGHAALLHLPDGRWVVARRLHDGHGGYGGYGWLLALILFAGTLAVGAYPVVRSITGRLERLRARVDALGTGDLSVRVKVEGRDEVAALARSFNDTAQRLEKLVNAQGQMLASASHELRSPLARMRVAVELLQTDNRPQLRDELTRDIAELDDLIGEILLASRLDTLDHIERRETVDLLALLAEEASRAGASVSGTAQNVPGDPRLLRKLVRNLLENAQRHSNGGKVQASVVRNESGDVLLTVEDRGPGVPEDERERIFEPFYRARGTPETGEGVGLGLALVRQIVERHGGRVRCLPRAGGGTRFEVSLPSIRN
jgi:signal transduction histidine kinase